MSFLLAIGARCLGWMGGILSVIWPYLLCAVLGAYGWQHWVAGRTEAKLQARIDSDVLSTATFKHDASQEIEKRDMEMQQTKETYETAIARQKSDLAAAVATGNGLRNAVSAYASSYAAGLPAAQEVTVLRQRLSTIGLLYGEMAGAGEDSATKADAVNNALLACEATAR